MRKLIRSLVILLLITILSNTYCFAKSNNSTNGSEKISLATAPPTVTSPIYYCVGSPATPLTATPSGGGTLTWYAALIGGVALIGAPTPITTTVRQITYYVTETVGGVESTPRTPIVVNVVADNGATILGLRCDASQVTTTTSVFFDWSTNPAIPNSYNYTYTIQGGLPVTGNTGPTHVEVFGMLPGQSATLILTSALLPCVPSQTITCSLPCGASTTTPNFAPIAPFCTGSVAPTLGPTSPNGITGTWLPTIISNTLTTTYTFTPDPILFPCALKQTMLVTVTPLATPTFTTIPAFVCQGSLPLVLPTTSNNATPITGTWSPAAVNTAFSGPT